MPSLEKMREKIEWVYGNRNGWKDKCEQMSSKQVYAIYHSLEERGKLGKQMVEPINEGQVSIWDLGIDLYGKGSS